MTPAEFKRNREKLGLDHHALAAVLDINHRTIECWEAEVTDPNSRKPNPIACQVLRWLLDGFRPKDWETLTAPRIDKRIVTGKYIGSRTVRES